jgi:hypothetical protein
MFYPDEKIVVKVQIDNSISSKDILNIACTLKYSVMIKKNATEYLDSYDMDLKLF